MVADDDINLTERGRQILRNYGSRMRQRLQQTLSTTHSSAQIKVRVTNKKRTRQSAREFLSGMFTGSLEHLKPVVKRNNFLLKNRFAKVNRFLASN